MLPIISDGASAIFLLLYGVITSITSTLSSGLVIGSFFVTLFAIIGSSWFVIIALELIPQKWRHWSIFPFIFTLLMSVPYYCFSLGSFEFLSILFESSQQDATPFILLLPMIGATLCNLIATSTLLLSRTFHTILWLSASFERKKLSNTMPKGTKIGIQFTYASVFFALVSLLGIYALGLEVNSNLYYHFTLFYGLGGILTYLYSKSLAEPQDMIALPSLASGSPYIGIAMWFFSRFCSIIGLIVTSIGLAILPSIFTRGVN